MSPKISGVNVLSSDRIKEPTCDSPNFPVAIICSRSMSLSSFIPSHFSSTFSLRQKMNAIATGKVTSMTTAAISGRHNG
jgi:hypothetical protein